MRPGLAARIAWPIWLLSIVVIAIGTVLGDVAAVEYAYSLITMCFASVGLMIRIRQPANRIGWVFAAVGVLAAIEAATNGYTLQARGTGLSPLDELVAWLGSIVFLPLFGLIGALFLLFPNGRPASRRWRVLGWVGTVAMVMATSGLATRRGPLDGYLWIENPVALSGRAGDIMKFIGDFGAGLFFASILAAGISLLFRMRRSRGEERLQIKWFAYASAMAATIFMIVSVAYSQGGERDQPVFDLLFAVGLAAIPTAAGVAILKYRLYDIDLIINRTLVYGGLTALLATTYFGMVVLLQGVIPAAGDSDLTIAGSTLAVAALFRPLRSRLQGFIDRRFYRRKFDAQRTLQSFSSRLRNDVDLDHLSADLLGVVRETMQPEHASLWLRGTSATAGGAH
jgi:hypothetical protein